MGNATALRRAAPDRARPVGYGCHVHGMVPAGTALPSREVELVSHGRIAGLVRQSTARPASRARRELLAHAELLDRTAATTPVLPLRFGTVLPSQNAVQRELLVPYHDAFAAALDTLVGRVQFTVRARYVSDAILREVVEHHPQARRMHQQLWTNNQPDHSGRVMFGEIVAHAIMASREADTAELTETLRPYAALTSVQISSSVEGYGIADAAFLVDLDQRTAFEYAVEELAGRWRYRARLRLLGPMAAYHFADQLIYGPPEGR
jgi:hypothetical protein